MAKKKKKEPRISNCSPETLKEYERAGLLGLILYDHTLNRPIQFEPDRLMNNNEIYTPSWVCKKMNYFLEEERKDVDWKTYVKQDVLEITCGEAPFLCSRYDVVSGKPIDLKDRYGLIDLKIQKINEHNLSKKEWIEWVLEAYKHTYGYELNADALFKARDNMFKTFLEYYAERFQVRPDLELQSDLLEIITWNIFQMDGLKYTHPDTGDDVLLMDWDDNAIIPFKSLVKQC